MNNSKGHNLVDGHNYIVQSKTRVLFPPPSSSPNSALIELPIIGTDRKMMNHPASGSENAVASRTDQTRH